MKILFPIGTLYPSQQGGPSNTVYWIAKGLVAKGVEVTILTTNIGTEKQIIADQWLNTDYGRVIYHSTRFAMLPLRMLRSIISAIPHCDLVHLTSLFYPPSLITAFVARWYRKPIVWSPRGELDRLALVYSPWKKKPVLWLIRQFLANQVMFHSTSPEETKRVKAIIGQDAQIVEIANFLELPLQVKSFWSTKPNLLCIGRIHPKKAIENLIIAISNSPKFLRSDLNLIIAGDCNNLYGEQLKKQVSALGLTDKIRFIGHIEGSTKQELYANAYFSILPSHTENFGNVVIESLAQGTPVIASTGTPWKMLEEDQAGFWVDNSPVSLAGAIEKSLDLSYDQYAVYRANALKMAYGRFNIFDNVQAWLNAYQLAITAKKSA